MPDFTIIKILSVIFTPDFNISNSLRTANLAFELLGDELSGTPSILPIPQDAPADIPRIILKSSDGQISLSISPSRTNFEFVVPMNLINTNVDCSPYQENVPHFFTNFSSQLDLRVQRLGFVTERLEFREDALSFIKNEFCNATKIIEGGPFHNSERFEIHSLKKYIWESFSINSWVRMKSIPFNINNEIRPAFSVQNDLNTLPYEEDPGADFNQQDISRFFINASNHIEQILDIYFR